uniref:Uncharacterized protein n=1 Tax=Chromera velia CCMP2878 TaxID=1169474 RepID=A0A0G4HAA8_9ALVE|eukprot:Cvel_6094.t1-p1 / transcript=Cvel_6094.t1 / gene=Cvel_6094 / organism=Chromera_velia_CCMP2878 / gene_product=hypothetical protein / transcript_product=hypothetical protein / location=Cvel_scaffold293:82674-84732(+) / protein_length=264 / sequence_SO=supercontig / SO=protein_coding / is_pseudo=false
MRRKLLKPKHTDGPTDSWAPFFDSLMMKNTEKLLTWLEVLSRPKGGGSVEKVPPLPQDFEYKTVDKYNSIFAPAVIDDVATEAATVGKRVRQRAALAGAGEEQDEAFEILGMPTRLGIALVDLQIILKTTAAFDEEEETQAVPLSPTEQKISDVLTFDDGQKEAYRILKRYPYAVVVAGPGGRKSRLARVSGNFKEDQLREKEKEEDGTPSWRNLEEAEVVADVVEKLDCVNKEGRVEIRQTQVNRLGLLQILPTRRPVPFVLL